MLKRIAQIFSRPLGAENRKLRSEISDLKARLAAVYQRTPAVVDEKAKKRRDLERLLVLAGMGETNPIWMTVLSYADELEQDERLSALQADLSDSVRQYNAGRAASAYDFACGLRDLRVLAELEAKRLKAG